MTQRQCQKPGKSTDASTARKRVDQILAEARLNLQSGQLPAAEALYHQVLQCNPDHPTALYSLGLIRYRDGNHDAAVKLISKALRLKPLYAEAHATLGIVHQNQGRLTEAEECFHRALELNPNDVDVHNNLGALFLNQGKFAEATKSFRQAIALKPDYADAHNNLGVVFVNQWRLDAAVEYFKQAIALQSDHADAHNNLGVVLVNHGRVNEAKQSFRDLLALKPEHADAHNNLGVILLGQGQLTEAAHCFRQAIALKPEHADAHNNLGSIMVRRSRPAEATRCFRRALTFKPDHVEAYNNWGLVLLGQGQLLAAGDCFRNLLALKPDHAEAHNNLGVTLLNQGQLSEAAACFRQAIGLKPDHADAHNNLGAVLLTQGRLNEAEEYLYQALVLKPDYANAHNNLGQVFQQQGKLSVAAECFRTAIRLSPGHAEAHRNLVNCFRVRPGSHEIQRIESLLQQPKLNGNDRISLGFALGKAYDDIGNYAAAFASYEKANRLCRAQLDSIHKSFDIDQLAIHVDELIAAYPAELFSNPSLYGSEAELPIFVVGMFRSGTSLVEQILSSHSRVCGGGELKNVSSIVTSLPSRLDGIPYPKCVAKLDPNTLADLASGYLSDLREIGGSKPYVADKMPNNLWHIGLISLLFPKAKIILCRRDPRDICLSCFFQRFTDEATYYTTDLADCGRFYVESERLAGHWKSVVPARLLQLNYEDLVAHQEMESRRIIEFLGLEWESACLNYHRTKRDVMTASAWQVRQPVYTRSVGRWQHYEKNLAPLLKELERKTGQVKLPTRDSIL